MSFSHNENDSLVHLPQGETPGSPQKELIAIWVTDEPFNELERPFPVIKTRGGVSQTKQQEPRRKYTTGPTK